MKMSDDVIIWYKLLYICGYIILDDIVNNDDELKNAR